nr:OpgC domain-containing protein [Chloroflexia bacterium]
MARATYPATQAANTGVRALGGRFLTLPASWLYRPEGNRDLRLDLLRGYCLFIIIADHISYYPAFTLYFTGGGYFIVSAAEGFIFISGMVMGMVYGTRAIKYGLQSATEKILHRAWQLYLWNIIVALGYLLLAYFTPLHTRKEAVAPPPNFDFDLVVKLLTLKQSFGWSDLLATYAVLVAISPVVLYFLLRKKTPWVLGLSWAFWLGYQVFPQHFSPEIGTFPLFAWQLLFVNGLVIGYHREAIKEFFSRIPKWKLYTPLLVTFFSLLALGIAWVFAGAFAGNADLNWFLGEMFDKMALRPGRVLTFFVFFATLYVGLSYFWEPIRKALGWVLIPLGQNSLYVYILHGFVVSIFFNIPGYGDGSMLVHTLGHLTALLALWTLVKNKVLFQLIPR